MGTWYATVDLGVTIAMNLDLVTLDATGWPIDMHLRDIIN